MAGRPDPELKHTDISPTRKDPSHAQHHQRRHQHSDCHQPDLLCLQQRPGEHRHAEQFRNPGPVFRRQRLQRLRELRRHGQSLLGRHGDQRHGEQRWPHAGLQQRVGVLRHGLLRRPGKRQQRRHREHRHGPELRQPRRGVGRQSRPRRCFRHTRRIAGLGRRFRELRQRRDGRQRMRRRQGQRRSGELRRASGP